MNPVKWLPFTLLVFHFFQFSTSIDSITLIHSIKDNELMISSGGVFALGFFSPGKSQKRYVGIWFHQVQERTVVWVANRDDPINDSSGVLSLNGQGNLVLYQTNQSTSTVPVWSTNVSVTSRKGTVAQLLDSGNFVLVENGTKKILWQSSDHPTDTLLPRMKLGLDRRTGLDRFLTSWKSADDPGSGEYSQRIDPTGFPQLFIYKGSVKRWRSGSWTGQRWTGLPETNTDGGITNFTFVNNQDEVYITFSVNDGSVLTITMMSTSGLCQQFYWKNHVRALTWSGPNNLPCDYYGHCGPNSNCIPKELEDFECTCLPGFEPKNPKEWNFRNWTSGCTRKRGMPTCQRKERFEKVTRVKVPDTSAAHVNMNLDLKACENRCLSSCSCLAYASAYYQTNRGTGCLTYHEDMMDTRSYSSFGQDLYVRVADEPDGSLADFNKKRKKDGSLGKKTIVAVVIASFFAMLLGIATATWLIRRKRREKASLTYLDKSIIKEHDLPLLDLKTIATATNNFSLENKLGEGGFGLVYKGQLPNGQEIAIKRLSKNSGQGISEFKNEVLVIAKLQHRNLVRLLACCIDKGEKMLIYEFMPNKSLDYFIFGDQSRKGLLDWKRRYDIILGIARGIIYLHQDSRLKIIHRDLKVSNILLDHEMNPKISDFGTAKIFGGDETQANTKRVVGTYGYMSPEYALNGHFSTKSDIFSFGVIILEIISGMKNNDLFFHDLESNMIRYTWELWRNDKALEIVDSCIADKCLASEVLRCIQVGLLCVQDNAKDRPNLSTVIFMLSNETKLPCPKKSTFVIKNESDSSSVGRKCSVNEVTITTLNAR